jgi:hypothetical protein
MINQDITTKLVKIYFVVCEKYKMNSNIIAKDSPTITPQSLPIKNS